MCVFHLNFSRLDVKLCAQELGTEKCKLNAKCLTAHLTNCAWERLSPLSALSSDEHQFRVPAGPKPLEEQKGHMDCFFSSKLGLPDSNPGGCTDDWRMPGPDILNRLARKSLKSFIRQFQGLPLGIQGLAVRSCSAMVSCSSLVSCSPPAPRPGVSSAATSDAERAWFRRAVNCSLVSSRTGLTNHPSHLICKYTALHPLKAMSKTSGSKFFPLIMYWLQHAVSL